MVGRIFVKLTMKRKKPTYQSAIVALKAQIASVAGLPKGRTI